MSLPSTLRASWRSLPIENVPVDLVKRSSHSLVLFDGKALIFGGEEKPRTPIGNEILLLDTRGSSAASPTSDAQLLRDHAPSDGSEEKHLWPQARVGAAMTSHPKSKSLFLWGGRAGKEMKPIGVRTANDEADGQAQEDLWRFDCETKKWDVVQTRADRQEDFPPARSFHTMTSCLEYVYVHAGCPVEGRLGSLHSFNLHTRTWKRLADAPGPARGGTVLTTIAGFRPSDPPLLARWGGFCGYELGGPLDVYDASTDKWSSYEVRCEEGHEPAKRSVHGFVSYSAKKKTLVVDQYGKQREAIAIMFMGEGEGAPKDLGHDGAGKFLCDVYVLLRTTQDESPSFSWLPLDVQPSSAGETPEPRGWFAFDVKPAAEGDGVEIVLHGGLNESNERLGDAWMLMIDSV